MRTPIIFLLLAGIALASIGSAGAAAKDSDSSLQTRRFCVFDPTGAGGLIYQSYDDYVEQARSWGYALDRTAYTDEAVLANDFKAGRCDMAAMTGFRAMEFVKFSGSLDMAGGLTSYADEKKAVAAMSTPRAAPYMQSGDYAVAGILPLGKAYLFAHDRRNLTVKDGLVGKKIAVLNYDKQASTIAEVAGASAVPASIAAFGNLFNNGAVDLAYSPATGYQPFELAKGMGQAGGVSDFVLGMVSDQVLLHRKRFDAGFALQSRQWTLNTLFDPALAAVQKQESAIPEQYWVHLSDAQSSDYRQMIRDVREKLWDDGWYDHRMQRLLKKIRCTSSPGMAECTAASEGGQ